MFVVPLPRAAPWAIESRPVGAKPRNKTHRFSTDTRFLQYHTEVVVRRLRDGESVFAADARFLAANTDRVTKFALPSPFLIAVRYWHADSDDECHNDLSASRRFPYRATGIQHLEVEH